MEKKPIRLDKIAINQEHLDPSWRGSGKDVDDGRSEEVEEWFESSRVNAKTNLQSFRIILLYNLLKSLDTSFIL